MKSFYFVMISLTVLTSCIPSSNKKSVLDFLEKSPVIVTTSIANLEQSGLIVRASDRYYVSALLLDVFGETALTAVNNYIRTKMDNFGGGCDQYDRSATGICSNDDCSSVICNGTEVINNQIGVSSVIRQGWTRRACEEISNDDIAILFAIEKIVKIDKLTILKTPPPTETSLIKAYGTFYRSSAPNNSIVSALSNVAKNENTNNFEKWRYVLLAICTTPEWQIP